MKLEQFNNYKFTSKTEVKIKNEWIGVEGVDFIAKKIIIKVSPVKYISYKYIEAIK